MSRFLSFLLISALVAYVTANGQDQGQPPFFECVEDGYFADYHRSCIVYYHCEKGVKTTFGCRTGEQFDEKKAMCVPEEEVSCPYPSRK